MWEKAINFLDPSIVQGVVFVGKVICQILFLFRRFGQYMFILLTQVICSCFLHCHHFTIFQELVLVQDFGGATSAQPVPIQLLLCPAFKSTQTTIKTATKLFTPRGVFDSRQVASSTIIVLLNICSFLLLGVCWT